MKAANGPLWPFRRLDPIPRPWAGAPGRSLILNRVKRRHRSWCRIGRLAECRAGDERDRRRTGKIVSRCPSCVVRGSSLQGPHPRLLLPCCASAGPAPLGRCGVYRLQSCDRESPCKLGDSSRRDHARNAQMIEDTTRRSADSRRSAIGCQRIRLSGRGYAVIQ